MVTDGVSAPVDVAEARVRALDLLQAEDERNDKIHDLLETIREQIRVDIAPEHRPEGLMTNIQNAVYGMRGRMRLMNDVAITAPLSPPIKAGEAVPVAWKWVPVEPTEAMCSADAGTATTDRLAWNRAMYRAMIAASPQPEAYGVRITDEMVNAALPHLIGTSDKAVRPIGQFWPGMTADESEVANWYFYGADRVRAALEAALSHTEQGETP